MAGCRVPMRSLIPHASAAPANAETQSLAMYAADSPVRPILLIQRSPQQDKFDPASQSRRRGQSGRAPFRIDADPIGGT